MIQDWLFDKSLETEQNPFHLKRMGPMGMDDMTS